VKRGSREGVNGNAFEPYSSTFPHIHDRKDLKPKLKTAFLVKKPYFLSHKVKNFIDHMKE